MESAELMLVESAMLCAEPDDDRRRPKSNGFRNVPSLSLPPAVTPRPERPCGCDTYRTDRLPHMSSPVGSTRGILGPALLEDLLPEFFEDTPRAELSALQAGDDQEVVKETVIPLLEASQQVPAKLPFQFLEPSEVQGAHTALKDWFSELLDQHEERIQKHLERLTEELRSSLRPSCLSEGSAGPGPAGQGDIAAPTPAPAAAPAAAPGGSPHGLAKANTMASEMRSISGESASMKQVGSWSSRHDIESRIPSLRSVKSNARMKRSRNATRHAPICLGAHIKDIVDELGLKVGEEDDEVVIQSVADRIMKSGENGERARWSLPPSTERHTGSSPEEEEPSITPVYSQGGTMARNLTRMKSAVEDLHTKTKPSEQPWAKQMIRRLNLTALVAVTLNALVLFLDLERQGQRIAAQMGQISGSPFGNLDVLFLVLDHCFNLFFVVEFSIRLYILRSHYFKDAINVFEAGLVVLSSVDLLLRRAAIDNGLFHRVASACKAARVIRLSRVARVVKELRVLMVTCMLSMRALLWSAVLLVLIIFVSSLFVAQVTHLYMIENCTTDSGLCSWAYLNYGSSSRAFWTMFRATLSGGWPAWADTLIQEVSAWYAVFWFLYIIIVWFAVIRILAALFLKQTLDVAAADQETQIAEKLKLKSRFADKLRKLFTRLDSDQNGMVTFEEFGCLIEDKEARAMMSVLEIDFQEIKELFYMLDDGDGEISFDEFLAGAVRIKGTARAIDQVVIMHNQNKMLCRLEQIQESVQGTCTPK